MSITEPLRRNESAAFEPVAIVGRGCVLPDALDPETFWHNVRDGRSSLGPVPEGRWRLDRERATGTVDDHLDRTWTDVGGYVRGFDEVFDPSGLLVPAGTFDGLDPLFAWVVQGVRQALREAGLDRPSDRTGLVLGNLLCPTDLGARYAEHVLRGLDPASVLAGLPVQAGPAPDPRNRFSAGLPAQLAAQALGLGAGGFSVEAACASSLYAVQLACERLHEGSADVVVAGGVNRIDNLFQHVGFCGLNAVSRSGRSRPLHREADGLLHGEGAAFVALMRLSDALATGTEVLAVVRGIGLSNDGRGQGLLSPTEEGQQRAMRLAYELAGVDPATVSLVECHATGTPVGDAAEVRSTAAVLAEADDVPIGSVKSNLGHLLAPAGAAGLLKVVGALRAGVRPPSLHADDPLPALAGTPLRVLQQAEPWSGPRRAAVSSFGFGGTNAHLLLEDAPAAGTRAPRSRGRRTDDEVVLVA
ncbi:beta-ketoacyl [acyl carrier protein] synthase domain-containing protein, partial [Angustibacter aerolatus]